MMMKEKIWNPYLAGGLTGVVAILSVWLSDKFFGASTTFARTAGMIEKQFDPDRVARLDYFVKYTPQIDWQFMFVIGIFLGALIAATLSGTFRLQAVPDMWKLRFGSNPVKRGVVAFLGGVVAIFGARLAGGCPSGHGLSGLMQMSLSGYIALACFFVGGIIVVQILYREGDEK